MTSKITAALEAIVLTIIAFSVPLLLVAIVDQAYSALSGDSSRLGNTQEIESMEDKQCKELNKKLDYITTDELIVKLYEQAKKLEKKTDYIITLLEEAEIARELGLDDDIYTEPLMLDDVR